MRLSAEPAMPVVGQAVTLTVTLGNQGCGMLGLPKYYLDHLPSGVLEPDSPPPVLHYVGLRFGQEDSAAFVLRALRSGAVTLHAWASMEVHLGYPGPAYWSAASAPSLHLTVAPFDPGRRHPR
jgi:hypothetical protein